jgi:ribosomal protein S27E
MSNTEKLDQWEIDLLIEEEGEDLRADREAMADKSHPGFKIECKRCGSLAVVINSSLGYSWPSGGWGSIDLKCMRCELTEVIYES